MVYVNVYPQLFASVNTPNEIVYEALLTVYDWGAIVDVTIEIEHGIFRVQVV